MKRFLLSIFILFPICLQIASANDSSYYMSGNQLIPLKETDISVAKEILTIKMTDSDYINVDVYYEFYNPGKEKTIVAGFEAMAPNMSDRFSREGVHPYMSDFKVVVNGVRIGYRTGLVHCSEDSPVPFQKIEGLDRMVDAAHFPDDCPYIYTDALWDDVKKDAVRFSYAYYSNMTFKHGMNVVRHSYRYRKSEGVGFNYCLPYLLTPALRWANHQIDDFTLVISASGTFKHFLVNSDSFKGADFRITKGVGKMRKARYIYDSDMAFQEICLRNGQVEWHMRNYRPSGELSILSADFNEEYDNLAGLYGSAKLYDRTVPFSPEISRMTAWEKKVLRNAPFANRGYVFKSKELQDYFSKIWWYVPDPSWNGTMEEFTAREKALIDEILRSEAAAK